jgi:hypothetical protein
MRTKRGGVGPGTVLIVAVIVLAICTFAACLKGGA